MEEQREEKEYFTISIVSRMFNLHPQTLRIYEREGLLSPDRSPGNTRLYSRSDVERIETILSLTKDLGVNLAGVDVILRMREELEEMRKRVQELFDLLSPEDQTRYLDRLKREKGEVAERGKRGYRKIEIERE